MHHSVYSSVVRITAQCTLHVIYVTKTHIGCPAIEQIAKYTFPPTASEVSTYIVHEMIFVMIST